MEKRAIAVVGARGHTGAFVVDELRRRGHGVLPIGRDLQAIRDVAAVINCAGPFLDSALPVLEVALARGAHYLDVTAEQAAAAAVFERAANETAVAVIPAMAFYGGFADLLATAAMGDWKEADAVCVAIGLDRWWPTAGTRKTGERNTVPRVVIDDHAIAPLPSPVSQRTWSFPEPWGTQEIALVPFSETILFARHLRLRRARTYINTAPLMDLRDAATPPPPREDERGRSPQRFVVDVSLRKGAEERRVIARGRDIYAITAPLVVEATERVLTGKIPRMGALAPGEAFGARDFLARLADVDVAFSEASPPPIHSPGA